MKDDMDDTNPECLYGMNHLTDDLAPLVYLPHSQNALNSTTGAWVIKDNDDRNLFQADYCPYCGTRLPLAPRGEELTQENYR